MSAVQNGSPLTLQSPGALAAAIPALVGFHPTDSLVAVFLAKSRIVVTMRQDLPEDLSEIAENVASTGTTVTADEVVLVICTGKPTVGLPHEPGVDALLAACETADLFVRDVLLIDGGRFWSYMCQNGACCPPEGTAIPQDCPLNAERVGAGLPAAADSRDAVVKRYAARPGQAPSREVRSQAESIRAVPASERARQCWAEVTVLAADPQHQGDAASDLMRSRLQLAMGDVRVRDFILARIAVSEQDTDALVEVVVQAALTAPEDLRPRVAGAAAALLAACGESTIAVDCLLELAEGDSLADLVRISRAATVTPATLRTTFASALPLVEDQLRRAERIERSISHE